jgi:hypothetical protein
MARNLRNLTSNNRAKQALEENKRAKIVEETPPPPPPPPPAPAPISVFQGQLVEGTDYGDIRVEGGKLVLDTDDIYFNPDYGTF